MRKILGKVTVYAAILTSGLVGQQLVSADDYVIQNGDSFFSIAQSYGIDAYELAQANQMDIFDVIGPGQVLAIPGTTTQPVAVENSAPTATTTYVVQEGDSFSSIAAVYGMDAGQLASLNGLTLADYITVGQTLQVSALETAAAATPSSTIAASSYYLEGYDYEPGINYPVGQCTWAVQKLTGWAGDWWGNAADWARNASRDGYTIGAVPVAGAIAVWDDGAYGHVAYVTDVAADGRIQVLEANTNGRQWIDNHRGWINPQDTTSQLSYIYPKY